MLHAMALGAGWIWLADDDGRAADDHVLATLLELADRRGLAAVSPTVADADDPDRLAFPLRRGLTWHRSRAALAADVGHGADHELLPGIAALFNGALFRASTLDVIGVPDLRLFIRGDEVEMHRRLVRSGLPFGTALGAVYLHPRADADDKPMLARPPARPRPRRPGEALLHVPQPRLPHRAAGDASRGRGRATPVRVVLPRHQAQPAGVRAVAAARAAGAAGTLPPGLRSALNHPGLLRDAQAATSRRCRRGRYNPGIGPSSALRCGHLAAARYGLGGSGPSWRKTTVRSITKLMTVARPWAITQATLTRSGMAGSTASISALVPTLIANVVP